VQETVGTLGVETKTDAKTRVFISYSRKDMAFADKLEAALKARGFEVLIDRQEIYAFEDWWKRIEALIGGADTIVFVLSPDSVKSHVALKEVAHAASLNKRFAPIVCRRVEDSAVPEALRQLNFIFFDDAERFYASADRLVEALRTDIGWIREHTRFGETAREWAAGGRPNSLLLRPPTLDVAEYWMASRPQGAPEVTSEVRTFLAESRKGARASQRLRRIALGSIIGLMMAVILGLIGVIKQDYLKAQWLWWTHQRWFVSANIWPYALNAQAEQALKPGDTFRECAPKQQDKDYCPDMVVVPAGTFEMGSPQTDKSADTNELPQHQVTIAVPFAVSKFELTFAEWDACVAGGGCSGYNPSDASFGRGEQPAINVNWDDAQQYVAWLSEMTGKTYRLLTEAEYEYATRAGTTTEYPWGDDIGKNNANCDGCGSLWDSKQTAPVGSFPPNKFGLYDMVGNIWEWMQDCYHASYEIDTLQGKLDAPSDGSAWIAGGNCVNRVVRGGSGIMSPVYLRSAARSWVTSVNRINGLGFRVGRTLDAR
jgi:formylglycine-generating enzyme required for sulfatase activity